MLTKIKVYTIYFSSLFLFFVIIILPLSLRSQLWVDEVLDADPAYNLAFHNKMGLRVWEGMDRVEEIFFMRPPVGFIILSNLYKLFGFKRWVTLSVPFFSAIFSFCIVYLMAMVLTKDFSVSILSSLLFGFSPLGVWIAKSGRHDALALFFFTSSLFLFLISEEKQGDLRKILILFSGVIMSLSAQTYHLYAFLFFSFIFYFIFDLRYRYKDWFKEMFIFSAAFFLTLTIWISFILQDIEAFRLQTSWHLSNDLGLHNFYKSNFLIQVMEMFFWLLVQNSPFTLIFFIIGNIFFVRRFPRYKKLFIGFILLPACFLFFFNLLRDYYIQITLPLGYIGLGFFVIYLFRLLKNQLIWNNKRYAILILFSLLFFILFHFTLGVVAKYVLTIKDWKARDLATYERGLISKIPAGSNVLGGPENWYALYQNGSRLFLFKCLYHPSFNLNKIDYVVVPTTYYELKRKDSPLARFIKDRCVEIGRIGVKAYSYYVSDSFLIDSGYSSIIFKVRK